MKKSKIFNIQSKISYPQDNTIPICFRQKCKKTNGTPALATAGSGDCLAGICAAVLARGGQIPAAALIHNAAGHRAGMLYGRDSVTAEDIIRSFYLD